MGISLATVFVATSLAVGQVSSFRQLPPAQVEIPPLPQLPPVGAQPPPAKSKIPLFPQLPPISDEAPPAAVVPQPVIPSALMNASDESLTWVFDNLNHNGRFFFTGEAEYLLWFLKGSRSSFPVSSAGIIGGSSAIGSALGDNNPGTGPVSGGRLTLGAWQYDNNPWAAQGSVRTLGVEARFFFVGNTSAELSVANAPNLFRPFFDLNNHVDSGFLVSAPGVATGAISARAQLGLWGAEANVWKNFYYDKPGTTCAVDLMAGFRYLNATSSLNVNSNSVYNSTIAAGSPFASFAGNQLQVADSFALTNNFFGGQIGIGVKSWIMDLVTVEGSFRLALGPTLQQSTIAGSQVRTFANGTTTTSAGGLLALPSNIGTHSNYQFSQIPEANLKFVFPIGNQLTLSAGFSALYWNRVARAADQIDRSIDISQIPNFPGGAGATPTGLGHPSVLFQPSDLWVLGISFGAEYRW